MGPQEEEFYNRFAPLLINLLELEATQAGALFSLAFVSFICSDASNMRVLALCESIICGGGGDGSDGGLPIDVEVTEDLKVQAVQSWCLLTVSVDDCELVERSQDRLFEALTELLEDPTFELKVAAGEALALLWASAARLSPEADRHALCGMLSNDSRCGHAALTGLQALAKESSKHMKKKDRKEQRSAFREVAAYILEGADPEEHVRFLGADFKATSFLQLRLLSDLRRVLGDCFERGLSVYPVMADVLGIDPSSLDFSGERVGGQVKKGGAVDKRRFRDRDQDRRFKDDEEAWGGEDEG